MADPALGIGVIGLGFMGRTHVAAYAAAARAGAACRVVAVCDPDAAKFESGGNAGNLGSAGAVSLRSDVRRYTHAADLFRDPAVGAVSICTYTDTHVPLAIAALDAGKHVLVEKPVAVASRDVERLADRAAGAGLVCMPGMCMRFWPGWGWLHEAVRSGRYGAVRSATFQRVGAGPAWGAAFYRDFTRSGGALVDLHIHDADMILWCFGTPTRVMSAGTMEHLTSLYSFPNGPSHVSAEGGWSATPGAGFRMRYTVCFERATADFDLSRSERLVVSGETGTAAVALSHESGYEAEIRHFVEAVRTGGPTGVTLEDAVAVARLLEAERESLLSGRSIAL